MSGSTDQPPQRGRGLGVPIALLAWLIAVAAGGVAIWALKKANDATAAADRLAHPAQSATPAAATPATTSAPATTQDSAPVTQDPADPTTPAEVTLDPQRVWDVKYAPRDLTVQVTRPRYIDLDAPLVDDSQGEDISLVSVQGGATSIRFADGVTVASADSDGITPYDCTQKIRYSPLDAATTYNFRKGDVACVQTSRQAAAQRGESQQMVVLKIKDISAGGTVVLTARAWRVPS
jgi:hypothetical protein